MFRPTLMPEDPATPPPGAADPRFSFGGPITSAQAYDSVFQRFLEDEYLPTVFCGWPDAPDGFSTRLRPALFMDNWNLCYVFLIDGAGRARWRGCGEASSEDSARSARHVRELLEELDTDRDIARSQSEL